MGDIRVRPMLRDDLPKVLEIERKSFPTPWSQASFEHEIDKPSSIALVVEAEGRLAGYLCASTVLEETDLQVIAVDPDLRRTGLARILMVAMVRHAALEGIRKIHLEVRASNTAAVSLYRSLGFSQSGLRKGYYQAPPEDAILMLKEMGRPSEKL